MPPRRSGGYIILKKLPFSTKKDVFLLKNQPFLRSPFSSKMYKNRVIFWWYEEKVVILWIDIHERMNEIHAELAQLNQEANALMDEIQKAWEELK